MRKKHASNIFPLIFQKITDFQVSVAAKSVRLPPFILQHSDVDGYGGFLSFVSFPYDLWLGRYNKFAQYTYFWDTLFNVSMILRHN